MNCRLAFERVIWLGLVRRNLLDVKFAIGATAAKCPNNFIPIRKPGENRKQVDVRWLD